MKGMIISYSRIKFLQTTMAVLLLFLFSCKSVSRLQGNVLYGEGDCMPMVDTDRQRNYKPYTGELYAFRKSYLDSMYTQNMNELVKKGSPIPVSAGRYKSDLPPGTWVIMPVSMFFYSDENTIIVTETVGMKKDFSFFKCLTY